MVVVRRKWLLLFIQQHYALRWVAVDGAYDAVGNIRFLQMGDIRIRELDGQRCRGIVQIFCFRRADDGGCHILCPLLCQRNLLHWHIVFSDNS